MYNVLRKNNSGVYLKMAENKGDIVIYKTQDGLTKINVKFEDETVWLTQAQLVELYQTSKSNISEHIKHIFEEGELSQESTVRNFRTVQIEGNREVSREQVYYNLDMIISLGNALHFSKWYKTNFIMQRTGTQPQK